MHKYLDEPLKLYRLIYMLFNKLINSEYIVPSIYMEINPLTIII
jgi:hypothetical protein